MATLGVLAVFSVFLLVKCEQSTVIEDPLIESYRQQQLLMQNIGREMTVNHGEINNKIEGAFASTSQQLNKIAGDLGDIKNAFVKPCPPGYMKNFYGCYKFDLTPVTAYEAKKNCNGQLVTVTSAGEQLALQSLMVKNNVSLDNDFWTSGHWQENKWLWDQAVPFVYVNWEDENFSNILTESQQATVRGWFTGHKSFKLLYRATRDGMSGSAFHSRCDGKGPTISIGRDATTGNVFGGYTSLPWTGPSSGSWKTDDTAFIFKLCHGSCTSSKYGVVSGSNRQKAVYHDSGRGPTFGGGKDLCFYYSTPTYDTTNKYYSSSGYCRKNSQSSYTGSLDCGFNVKWTDNEVHQVLDGPLTHADKCMSLRRGDQRWSEEDCSTPLPYICEA